MPNPPYRGPRGPHLNLPNNDLPEHFSDWTSADFPPPENRPVLGIRKSSYISSEYEVLTVRYMPTYRPRSPWRHIDGNAVSVNGNPILGWMDVPYWLQPKVGI
jgi:hypothetical protein